MDPAPRRLAEALAGLPGSTVGAAIGPYVVEQELARGGYGIVFRARHTGLGRLVALKVLHEGAGARERHKARFLREAQLAAAIEHSGVVRILDRGEEEGLLYLAMELIEGETLRSIFDREAGQGGGSRTRLLELLAEVAEALEAAHAQGIVHRDLKPDNVLVRSDGHPVVTDFGLARDLSLTSDLTQTGVMVGTPTYMAPEQVKGQPASPASDVYALGVMLYQALTGQVPFWEAAGSPHAAYAAVIHEPPPRPSARVAGLPRAYDRVVAAAMAKSPAERPATAGAFAEALRAVLAGETPGLPRAQRTPSPLRIASGVALVAVGGLVGALAGRATPQVAAAPEPVAAVLRPEGPTPAPSPDAAVLRPEGPTPAPSPDAVAEPAPVSLRDGSVLVAPDWTIAHGLGEEALGLELERQRRARRVLLHLSVDDRDGRPRFFATWRAFHRGGPYRVGRTRLEFGADWKLLKANRFRPDRQLIYRRGEELRFVGTWTPSSGSWASWTELAGPEAWRKRERARRGKQASRPLWISAATLPGQPPAFSTVFAADGSPREGRVELDRAGLVSVWRGLRRTGYRINSLEAYGPRAERFAATWVKDGWCDLTFHEVSAQEHREVLEAMQGAGLQPRVLVEHPGPPVRYTTAWARAALGCQLRRTGADQPGLAAVDALIEKTLRATRTSRAAVAITRGQRLVYARGYAFGPRAMTATSFAARFRLGDLSRLLTSAAALRLVDAGRLRLDQPVAELLPTFRAAQAAAGQGGAFARVELKHLLEGSVPWRGETAVRKAAAARGETFEGYVSSRLGTTPPLTRADLLRFLGSAFRVEGRSGERPGGSRRFGYLLAGRSIEAAGGASYRDLVQRLVIEPVGARSVAPAGSRIGARAAGEVIHEGQRLSRDACGGGAGLVPLQYGGWNLASRDAALGWIGSAEDVARLLVALQPSAPAPLLSPTSRAAMFTRGPGRKRARLGLGWRISAQDPPIAWSSGTLTGSSALALMLPNEVAVIYLSNRGRLPESLRSELIAAIAAVSSWPSVDQFGGR